jgi:hypothetical protein
MADDPMRHEREASVIRDPLTLTFNAPEDGSGDQSSWRRIWVARGGLAALIDDKRLY